MANSQPTIPRPSEKPTAPSRKVERNQAEVPGEHEHAWARAREHENEDESEDEQEEEHELTCLSGIDVLARRTGSRMSA
jgi:hypothetical protein